MRAFCASLRVLDAATSKLASIRDAVTFACWPPGPEERLARTDTSSSGIARSSLMCNRSAIEGNRVAPMSANLASNLTRTAAEHPDEIAAKLDDAAINYGLL